MKNISIQFQRRIDKIWNSYINDQAKANNLKVNKKLLDQGVVKINEKFRKLMNLKTIEFTEILKQNNFKGLFQNLDILKKEKYYLDDDVKYLINNYYNDLKKENENLKEKYNRTKTNFIANIKAGEIKFKNSSDAQIEAYQREFKYKLNSEPSIIKKTLQDGLEIMMEKTRRVDNEMAEYKSRNNQSEFAKIENEIQSLRTQIKKFKINKY